MPKYHCYSDHYCRSNSYNLRGRPLHSASLLTGHVLSVLRTDLSSAFGHASFIFHPLLIPALICSIQFLCDALDSLLSIAVHPATSLRKGISAFPGALRCYFSIVQNSNPLKYGCAKMRTVCPVTSSFFRNKTARHHA